MGDVRWISTDGGPLLLLPAAKRPAWHGSYLFGEDGDFVFHTPSGPFAFRSDYDLQNPRTDYERACGIRGLVGLLVVDGAASLVLHDHPLDTTWRSLSDGGLFARVFAVESRADVEAELATLGTDAAWSDEGLALPGGEYLLMDALDHGENTEREPLPVRLSQGSYAVLSARVCTGSVHWVCIRLVRG